jgi:hypothetical protein
VSEVESTSGGSTGRFSGVRRGARVRASEVESTSGCGSTGRFSARRRGRCAGVGSSCRPVVGALLHFGVVLGDTVYLSGVDMISAVSTGRFSGVRRGHRTCVGSSCRPVVWEHRSILRWRSRVRCGRRKLVPTSGGSTGSFWCGTWGHGIPLRGGYDQCCEHRSILRCPSRGTSAGVGGGVDQWCGSTGRFSGGGRGCGAGVGSSCRPVVGALVHFGVVLGDTLYLSGVDMISAVSTGGFSGVRRGHECGRRRWSRPVVGAQVDSQVSIEGHECGRRRWSRPVVWEHRSILRWRSRVRCGRRKLVPTSGGSTASFWCGTWGHGIPLRGGYDQCCEHRSILRCPSRPQNVRW